MIKKTFHLLNVKQKINSLIILILIIFSMLLEMLSIGLVIPAIQFFVNPEELNNNFKFLNFFFNFNLSYEYLVFWGLLIIFVIFIFKSIYLIFFSWFLTKFISNLELFFSNKLFKTYLSKEWKFFLHRNSSELISNITNEVALFVGLVQAFLLFISEFFIVLGIFILLVYVQPFAVIIVSIILLLLVGIYYFISRKFLLKWGKIRQKHASLRIKDLQQGFGGIKDISIMERKNFFYSNFYYNNIKYINSVRLNQFLAQLPRIWLELFAVIGILTLSFIMISKNTNSSEMFIILGLFAVAAFKFIPSTNRIINALQNLKFGLPSLNRLFKEIDLKENVISKNINKNLDFRDSIKLENIYFKYNTDDDFEIKNINLKLEKGKAYGIIGKSGSGKTTFVDILLGLLNDYKGKISLDEEDILENISSWHNLIGYVPQSIFLSDDTIKNNIAFGIEDIDSQKLNDAIKLAQIEDIINISKHGINTLVGERGIRLSGGQIQRIGIARALYHGPKILILDEATSSLDVKTEEDIMKSVYSLYGNLTLIIIAHRISTLAKCDKIIRLKNGGISEETSYNKIQGEHVKK